MAAARSGRRSLAIALVIAVFVAAIDQASKNWVLYSLDLPNLGTIDVIPFVNLTMVWNAGISYGLFKQFDQTGVWILAAVEAVIVGGLLVWLPFQPGRFQALTAGLIAGGAVGNLYDRLVYGAVVDFIHLHAGGYNWYVFNVADVAVVVGGAILAAETLFPGQGDARKAV
jgi:signal peptidase II